MSVVIQELVIQSKIINDADSNKEVVEDLIKQMHLLKMQVKDLKEKIESRQNEDER